MMPRSRSLRNTLCGLAAAPFLLAAAGCERANEVKAGPAREGRAAPPAAKVELVHPERQTIRRTVGEPGQLQAYETTALYAKIPGYVKQWSVNIGAAVEKGQVLAELAIPELEAELRQKRAAIDQAVARRKQAEAAVEVAEANVAGAEAGIEEARAGVGRARSELARWQSEYQRVEELFRARAQTGSLLDETRSTLRSSEASMQEVQARVKTAEVALTQSRAALDQARSDVVAAEAAIEVAREDARRVEALCGYTRIEAPYDGIITRRHVDTGQLTRLGDDHEPLFVLARSDIVTISLDIPEVFAASVEPGDRATIAIQAMKGRTVEGKVTRTSWALEPSTRTLRIEIDIPNPGGALRPGLYAYATVIAEEHDDALTVPATAVISEQGKTYCVVVKRAKAVRRPIEVGLSDGTRSEIISGLEGRESVVKANAASLVDGQPVEPLQPASPAAP